MRYFYLILSVLLWSNLNAQEQPNIRTRADEHFNRYEYARAIPLYLRIADREDQSKVGTLGKLAFAYSMTKNYHEAENWYQKLIAHPDHTTSDVLEYARALKNNGKYSQAKEQYLAYSKASGATVNVTNEIAGCDSAMVWSKNPKAFQITNVTTINTDRSDFGTSAIGDKVYFVSEPNNLTHASTYGWTGNSFLKIFQTNLDGNAQLASPVIWNTEINNSDFHVGPIVSPDQGATIYATLTFPGKPKTVEKENKHRYRTNRLGLYIYTKNAQGKYVGVPFQYNNVEEYSVGHATFSKDGNTLYFASDMPGGKGQTDIWFVEKNADGTWSKPVNAGSTINTAEDELFPVINADGNLYFSSNGLPGVGGLDVFMAKGEKANWTSVQNLALPINSPADDFSFVKTIENDEQIAGFLSSDRVGGKGSDDIYAFAFKKPAKPILISVCGVVYDKTKKTPLAASVQLKDDKGNVVKTIQTDATGKYCFDLLVGQAYSLFGERVKYSNDLVNFSTAGITKDQVLSHDLYLDPIMAVGKTFVLENLYYDFDKHNIRPDAAIILNELIKTLNEYPSLKIELSSHTDSRGSDAYNMALSQRRAQAAVDYLIKNGISRNRLVAKGYGETKLVNSCANGVECSEADHQANRRTEFTVLEIDEADLK